MRYCRPYLCAPPLLSLTKFITPRSSLTRAAPSLSQHCVVTSNSHNIFENLSAEEALLRGVVLDKNCSILYLYVNAPCVVIGRNQNAVEEVALRRAYREGIAVARRSSGGGAVYHDRGNLCFSFFTHRTDYAPEKTIQLVRLGLCAQYGIDPSRLTSSKRHDLYLDGKKITGSAMRVQRDIAFHHCTLLVDSNRQDLGRYLHPECDLVSCTSPAVGSVRSVVTTLAEAGVLPAAPSPLGATDDLVHGRVRELQETLSHFFLSHVNMVMAHPSPWEIDPRSLCTAAPDAVTSDAGRLTTLDVTGAVSVASDLYHMVYGEGRVPPASDTTTLVDEVLRMRTRDWVLAMPRYDTHTEISRVEFGAWLPEHPQWPVLVATCALTPLDVVEEIVTVLFGADHAALHIRATVDHRRLTAVECALGPVLNASNALGDAKVDETWKHTSTPLPWLTTFLQASTRDVCADEVSLLFDGDTSLLAGFQMEAHEAFIAKLDLPADARDLCCEVVLTQLLACWQHKNVLDF